MHFTKRQTDLLLWVVGLWIMKYYGQLLSATKLSSWAIHVWLQQQGYQYHLCFVKHQIKLVFWAIGLWTKKCYSQLSYVTNLSSWAINFWLEQQVCHFQFMKHQVKIILWALEVWIGQLSSMDNHAEVSLQGAYNQALIGNRFHLTLLLVTTMFSWLVYPSKKRPKYYRRTSRASAIQANRKFLHEAVSMEQNVINSVLFFDESPSRADLLSMMMTLAVKYERMGSVAQVDSHGECTWLRIKDLHDAIGRAVVIDTDYEKSRDDAHALLRAHAHIGTILSTHDDEENPMPLWRVVMLSPTAALIRIDHAVCDGLSGECVD